MIYHHTNDLAVCPKCEEKLLLVHGMLKDWFRNHVKAKFPKVHISWGYRDSASQEAAFQDGKTKLHFPNSPHNKQPALALDLFVLSEEEIATFPYSMYSLINQMVEQEGSPIFWGGKWKKLGDSDHFELQIDHGPEAA